MSPHRARAVFGEDGQTRLYLNGATITLNGETIDINGRVSITRRGVVEYARGESFDASIDMAIDRDDFDPFGDL